MKSGSKPLGFTIVETMIVLAVTSALLISALALISGSQNKTQFYQSINDINRQINTVASNVANGYYNNTIGNYKCDGSGAAPDFHAGGNGLGTNAGCIFLGRVIQFTNGENFYVHNVVGRQKAGSPAKEVTTMVAAAPQIIEPGSTINTSFPSSTEAKKLKNGLTPVYTAFKIGAGSWQVNKTSGVAFLSSLGVDSSTAAGDLQSGGQSLDFSPVYFNPANDLTLSKGDFIDRFDQTSTFRFAQWYDVSTNKNPDGGLAICFDSGTTNQHGIITIGGKASASTTDLVVKNGKCDATTEYP